MHFYLSTGTIYTIFKAPLFHTILLVKNVFTYECSGRMISMRLV